MISGERARFCITGGKSREMAHLRKVTMPRPRVYLSSKDCISGCVLLVLSHSSISSADWTNADARLASGHRVMFDMSLCLSRSSGKGCIGRPGVREMTSSLQFCSHAWLPRAGTAVSVTGGFSRATTNQCRQTDRVKLCLWSGSMSWQAAGEPRTGAICRCRMLVFPPE